MYADTLYVITLYFDTTFPYLGLFLWNNYKSLLHLHFFILHCQQMFQSFRMKRHREGFCSYLNRQTEIRKSCIKNIEFSRKVLVNTWKYIKSTRWARSVRSWLRVIFDLVNQKYKCSTSTRSTTVCALCPLFCFSISPFLSLFVSLFRSVCTFSSGATHAHCHFSPRCCVQLQQGWHYTCTRVYYVCLRLRVCSVSKTWTRSAAERGPAIWNYI